MNHSFSFCDDSVRCLTFLEFSYDLLSSTHVFFDVRDILKQILFISPCHANLRVCRLVTGRFPTSNLSLIRLLPTVPQKTPLLQDLGLTTLPTC